MNEELEKAFKRAAAKLRKADKVFELKLLREYQKSLKRIRFQLSEIYRKHGDKVSFQEMAKFNRLEKLEASITKELTNLSGETISLLSPQLRTVVKESANVTLETVNSVLKTKIRFSGLNPELIKEAINNPYERVGWKFRSKGHHARAIQQIKSEITQGLVQGNSYSQTAAEITDRVNGLANNVVRIVRTESHRVQVKAANTALDLTIKNAKKLGIQLVKVISSVLDSRTRPQSQSMHGQVAGSDGLFLYPNGVHALPGETGVPGWDINDREIVIVQEKKNI